MNMSTRSKSEKQGKAVTFVDDAVNLKKVVVKHINDLSGTLASKEGIEQVK